MKASLLLHYYDLFSSVTEKLFFPFPSISLFFFARSIQADFQLTLTLCELLFQLPLHCRLPLEIQLSLVPSILHVFRIFGWKGF